ncbi:hypothetical protein V2I01_41585 [Micromonospora sp. BRA006-A]|nr:hypothetical protein [Micromonospora sp. BRA006-A]
MTDTRAVPRTLPTLQIRELRKDDRRPAAGLVARAMRDNPTTYAMFGDEPLDRLAGRCPSGRRSSTVPRRRRSARSTRAAWWAPQRRSRPAAASAPRSTATPADRARRGAAGRRPGRAEYVRAHYAIHDLAEPHWHVGPVGVEPRFRAGASARRSCRRCST